MSIYSAAGIEASPLFLIASMRTITFAYVVNTDTQRAPVESSLVLCIGHQGDIVFAVVCRRQVAVLIHACARFCPTSRIAVVIGDACVLATMFLLDIVTLAVTLKADIFRAVPKDQSLVIFLALRRGWVLAEYPLTQMIHADPFTTYT